MRREFQRVFNFKSSATKPKVQIELQAEIDELAEGFKHLNKQYEQDFSKQDEALGGLLLEGKNVVPEGNVKRIP